MLNNPFNNANATPNIYNFVPSNLIGWRTALAKTMSGQANARILCIGDSTTFGTGSNNQNGSAGGEMNALSYPTQLATLLNEFGVPANANGWMGDGSTAYETRATNDGRLVMGSAWSEATVNSPSIGGYFFQASTNTNALSFTPTNQVDTFVIWYVQAPSNGVLSAQINSGTVTNQNTAGTPGYKILSFTVTGTLGANTLNLKWSSGGKVFVVGVEAYNSAVKQVCVINSGWSGAKVVDIANNGNGYSPFASYPTFAADICLISIGINDWVNSESLATFQSTLQGLVTQCLTTGNVILVTPPPSSVSNGAPQASQQAFINVILAIATSNNVPVIDNWNRWGPQANNLTMYAQSGAGPGNLHPNMIGYNDFARVIARTLVSA
jgi:lysophospholipase L1-like esterase